MIMFALIACLALVLSGCAQIGFGMQPGKPALKNATVAPPAIGEEGTLRVGVDANNAPFATTVDDGRFVGIDVDIAAALADQMGLKLEIVDVQKDAEAALEAGTVDIVMGRDKSDTASSCWLSDPYIESAVALWAASTGTIMPTAASKPKIEAQESSMSAWEVTNQFGEDALVAVSDIKTAFEDLSSGETELIAADTIIGSYVNHTSNGSKAQILGLMQTPGGYCIGVSNTNNDLKTAVTTALRGIDEGGVIKVILDKWLGTTPDLNSLQMTEQAAKATGAPAVTNTQVSGVGSNAVEIEGGGASTTVEGNDTATAGSNYIEYTADPGYTEVYVDNTQTYVDNTQTYVDNTQTYVDPGYVVQDTTVYDNNTGTYVEEMTVYDNNTGVYVEETTTDNAGAQVN